MKQRLLFVFVSAVLVAAGWAVWVAACDQDKQTSAQASSTTSAASMSSCAAHGANATTADMAGCAGHGAKATTADMAGCAGHGAKATTAGMASCAGHGAAATTASFHECGMYGVSMTAVASANGGCPYEKSASMAAGSSCAAKGATKATTASDAACRSDGMMTTADARMHPDCDACADMVSCSQQLTANGAQTQILPLKNGVMFVYTTDTPSHVRAVQAAMTRRTQRLIALASSGDKAKLCPECKTVRGAIASGKLNRETVNIEGGCLTLMTSTDPAMIAKLHGMAGNASVARAKI
jgi:hypothetical protein